MEERSLVLVKNEAIVSATEQVKNYDFGDEIKLEKISQVTFEMSVIFI